jgi:hypothetical protein
VLLYRQLIKLQITPPQVDAMRMWQLASLFEDEDPNSPAPVRAFSAGGRDPYMKARIEAAKRGEGVVLVPRPAKNAAPVPSTEPPKRASLFGDARPIAMAPRDEPSPST